MNLAYVTGKTCTGKTTFAAQLGGEVIELDKVVYEEVIEPRRLQPFQGKVFVDIYRNRERLDLIKLFIDATRDRIEAAHERGDSAVVEGAIANTETLVELLSGYRETRFLYLHPTDLDRYVKRISQRFAMASHESRAGLPNAFWSYVDDGEFAEFCSTRILTDRLCESIERYARTSMGESAQRLAGFRATFENIEVVEV